MEVWFVQNRKKATCSHCKLPIENSNSMVVGRLRKKATGEVRKWCLTFRWHPDCYLAQGMDYMESHPKVETRGRKCLGLDQPVRQQRLLLQRRRASVVQRVRREMGKLAEERSTERLVHLGSMLNQLDKEMESCGGLPANWE